MVIISKIPGGAELMNAEEVLKKAGLEGGMKVADFGCGYRAYFSLQAARMVGKDGLVYAIDILKTALRSVEDLAKFYNFKNIKTIWADLEVFKATKIEDNSIDFIIITNLFFQTKEHKTILKEAVRILKNGGKVFIADWGKTASPLGPPFHLRVDAEKIKKLAQEVGLILEKEFPAGPYHFGLVFVKR
ncbi:MAG: class I SAM-dependent methyltransferase [Patescibacteria group bacterium]